ncbi:MAG: hypothetical protein WAU70_11365 [Flavobacteriales bacterium]
MPNRIKYLDATRNAHVLKFFHKELPRLRSEAENGVGSVSMERCRLVFDVPVELDGDIGGKVQEWSAFWNNDHRKWSAICRKGMNVRLPHGWGDP